MKSALKAFTRIVLVTATMTLSAPPASSAAFYVSEIGSTGSLRSDNGPELVSAAVQRWLEDKQVGTHYIDPGSPWQNAYSESFNSIFRTTCLDRWVFSSLAEARVVIKHWLDE